MKVFAYKYARAKDDRLIPIENATADMEVWCQKAKTFVKHEAVDKNCRRSKSQTTAYYCTKHSAEGKGLYHYTHFLKGDHECEVRTAKDNLGVPLEKDDVFHGQIRFYDDYSGTTRGFSARHSDLRAELKWWCDHHQAYFKEDHYRSRYANDTFGPCKEYAAIREIYKASSKLFEPAYRDAFGHSYKKMMQEKSKLITKLKGKFSEKMTISKIKAGQKKEERKRKYREARIQEKLQGLEEELREELEYVKVGGDIWCPTCGDLFTNSHFYTPRTKEDVGTINTRYLQCKTIPLRQTYAKKKEDLLRKAYKDKDEKTKQEGETEAHQQLGAS